MYIIEIDIKNMKKSITAIATATAIATITTIPTATVLSLSLLS